MGKDREGEVEHLAWRFVLLPGMTVKQRNKGLSTDSDAVCWKEGWLLSKHGWEFHIYH